MEKEYFEDIDCNVFDEEPLCRHYIEGAESRARRGE